jgi:hypothetical protein
MQNKYSVGRMYNLSVKPVGGRNEKAFNPPKTKIKHSPEGPKQGHL